MKNVCLSSSLTPDRTIFIFLSYLKIAVVIAHHVFNVFDTVAGFFSSSNSN